jgi:two-component system, OmpR family, phosphate regulon sensor histidine kinase PhoR
VRRIDYNALILNVLFAAAGLPLLLLWSGNDLVAGHSAAAAAKLLVFVFASIAFGAILHEARVSAWSRRVRAMESFVAAMPDSEPPLPEGGPVEIQRLARTLRAMAHQVRRIVDRANLEASRREAILACMTEGVLAVDADLKVTFCNEAFAQSFGAKPERVEGRALLEVVREPVLRDILQHSVSSGRPEKQRLRFGMAANRTFEVRTLPLGQQPHRGAVIVLNDITDIEHQEQVRKDFVADVSHELRTPLSAIRGFSETLLDGALEDPEHSRRFVEIIQSHAIRLGNIASDLLVLSDLDANKGPVEMQRVSVLDVIESAVSAVSNAAESRGVKINIRNCHECVVFGLPFRLEQALINLLDNAVKFNRENGEVSVCCEREEANVRITVSDSGIGIPSGDLKRVFERFYRVDKARSRPVGGTGLGLPIVKEVIERMGGTIHVESILGRGSKFTVVLKGA